MKPKPGDLILIRWEDAQHVFAPTWSSGKGRIAPAIVETVGWVVAIDKRRLTLGSQLEPKSRRFRCLNVIPGGMVRSLRRLG
jgi:hypothetical protein